MELWTQYENGVKVWKHKLTTGCMGSIKGCLKLFQKDIQPRHFLKIFRLLSPRFGLNLNRKTTIFIYELSHPADSFNFAIEGQIVSHTQNEIVPWGYLS